MRNKILAGFIVFMTIALAWLGISATGPVSSGVSVDPSTLVLTYPTNLWLTNAQGIWLAISNYVVATSAPTNALLRNNNLADVANPTNSLANLNGLPNSGGTGTNETFTGTNTFTGPVIGQSNISAQTLSVSGAQTLSQINTPATPSAGKVAVYAKNSAGVAKLFYLQPDGLEIGPLSIGGSGGSATNAITSMNGLTNSSQSIIVGTAGNDFAINSSGQTHEFDLPDASGTARGALTSADYKRIGFTNVANTWIPPQTFSTNIIVNGQVESADGTASKPGISFSSDTSLGIRPQSAGSLGIYSGGVSLYNFDATKFWPQTDGTRDLGGSANQFRDGYFTRNVVIGNNLTVSGTNTINNETFAQRIQPLIGITYDLGSATAQWNKIWTANESVASTLTANAVAVTNGITAKTLSVSGSPLLFSEQYGKNASATNTDALAVGYNSVATGVDSTAIGAAAQATGNSSVAIGAASGALAQGAAALGVGAIASGTNAVAIGGNSLASHLNSVALAENAVTTRTNQIVLGDSSFQTLIAGQLQANGSNTFNGPVRFTTEPLNSSLIFDCVVKETSGYVSNGTTALTVTGGNLSAANVGNTIEVWQPDQVFLDAYITNGTAKLISATANFTSVALNKTVEVSGAGVAGVSLVGTISSVDSATQVTLSLNASTTQTNVPARIISTPLVTTIAAVGGSTTATLGAAPSVTHTNAHVIYGTDNRALLNTDVATAQASGKRLVLGSGKALVLLSFANPWATTLSTNSITVTGKSRNETSIITIWNMIPTNIGGLFQVNTGGSIRASDMSIVGYGPAGVASTASSFPQALYEIGGGITQYLTAARLDITGMGTGMTIESGTANARYMRVEDCRITVLSRASSFFVASTGGPYECRMRDCYLEQTHLINTRTDDNDYNAHIVYHHPSVAEDWADVETHMNQTSSAYHVHHFGSPTNLPAFLRFARTRHTGVGNAFLFDNSAAGKLAEFYDCNFEENGSSIAAACDVLIVGGRSRNAGVLVAANSDGLHFRIVGHDLRANGSSGFYSTGGHDNIDIEVSGGYAEPFNNAGSILSTSDNCRLVHSGVTFNGLTGSAVLYLRGGANTRNAVKFLGCLFTGTYAYAPLLYDDASAMVDVEISHCQNDTSVPLFRDLIVTGTNAAAYGFANLVSTAGGEPVSDGRIGSHFASRTMVNPTNIASAATINPSFNYNTHQVTGSTTIDNILVGGSANRNRVAYETTLIAGSGATWATSTAGNIVPLSTVARTAGQAYTFRWDSINQKWREVGGASGGTPGGSAGQLQFNNSVFGGVPQMLWDGTRIVFTNGSNPYVLFRDTNAPADAQVYGLVKTTNGLRWLVFTNDLSYSNKLFDIIGTSGTSGGSEAIGTDVKSWGNVDVATNLTAASGNFGSLTSTVVVVNGNVTAQSATMNGPTPGAWKFQYPTADAFDFTLGRSSSAMATNVQLTGPTTSASVPSVLVATPDGTGTNYNLSFLSTNGLGASASFTNVLRLPSAPDSTNIDWGTNALFVQGYTSGQSFTNAFVNAPPASSDWHLQYNINNNNTNGTNIIAWLGPAGGGNAISNNWCANFNLQTNAITCPPGITRVEWGWNGSLYTFRTTSQLHITDTGTNVTVGTGQMLVPDGTSGVLGVGFSGLSTVGFYRSGNRLIIRSAGSGSATFDTSVVTIDGVLNILDGTTAIIQEGANAFQIGRADVAAPPAVTLHTTDGSGTDSAGSDWKVGPGRSTGSGRGGAFILQTSESLTTGSAQNSFIPRLYVSSKAVALTGGSATLVFNVSLASGKTVGLHVFATTRTTDATDFQSATDDFTVTAVNKGGTVSVGSVSTSLGSNVATSGTIATVWTAVANGNGLDIKCNQTSTVMTPTTRNVRWRAEIDTDDANLVVSPQ